MHESLPKDQQRQIKSFVDAAVEFNKTHNIFSRKTKEEEGCKEKGIINQTQ